MATTSHSSGYVCPQSGPDRSVDSRRSTPSAIPIHGGPDSLAVTGFDSQEIGWSGSGLRSAEELSGASSVAGLHVGNMGPAGPRASGAGVQDVALNKCQPITERQSEILSVIADHIATTGSAPTIREIGNAIGVTSTNAVSDHLHALERKGYIQRSPGKTRNIQLTELAGSAKRSVADYSQLLYTARTLPLADQLRLGLEIAQHAAGQQRKVGR